MKRSWQEKTKFALIPTVVETKRENNIKKLIWFKKYQHLKLRLVDTQKIKHTKYTV